VCLRCRLNLEKFCESQMAFSREFHTPSTVIVGTHTHTHTHTQPTDCFTNTTKEVTVVWSREMERSHHSSYLISSHLIWPHLPFYLSCVRWEATPFAVAATNQAQRDLLRFDWSQTRRELGRFTAHSLPLSSDEMRSDDDGMSWMIYERS